MEVNYVMVDGEYFSHDDRRIEFLNISEDVYGRDLMTFKYKGKVYESLIFIGKPRNH